MYSLLMKKNFNLHASTYNSYCDIQKTMAENLALKIKLINSYFYKVFEIGCGTGNFSKLLLNNLLIKNITLNDICPGMIKQTRAFLKNEKNITFVIDDFDDYTYSEKFNLITSNAVFQWFKNPVNIFNKIYRALSKNGILAFAMFIKPTFFELEQSLKKAFEDVNEPFVNPLLEFYTDKHLRNCLKETSFKIRQFEVQEYKLFYKDPVDFLNSLKKIGVSHLNDKNTGYSITKKMLGHYRKSFTNKENLISVTYNILYCICEKL